MPQKDSYFWIIFQLVLFFRSCTSNDTITHNLSFKDGDVLVSSGNTFAFGFFSPGKSLNLRYVGIWYNKIPEKTVVWVANRDNPIHGNEGVLFIENSGNLVLRDRSNMVSWSTNVWGVLTGKSYFVQLLETGNLVLCEGEKYGSNLLWQSFDYPTNTILPHMKIGVNRTSGSEWSLTSWKSTDDPGTGDFVIKMDLIGPPQVSLYKNSVRFWRSGPWNGIRWGGPPDKTAQFMSITVEYIENEDEVSTFYSFRDQTIICREFINEFGLFDSQIWQEDQHKWMRFSAFPKDLECDHYGHCGSFSNCNRDRSSGDFECVCLPGYEPKVKTEWKSRDGHNGCARKPGEPSCGNSTIVNAKAGFIKLPSVKVPDTRTAVSNASLGLKECADLCLKNCSCTAYATANVGDGGSGCITWYGDLMDIRQYPVMNSDYMTYSSYGAQDVYIKVSESQLGKYLKNLKDSDGKVVLIVALVPSIAGVILLVFAICLVLWRRKGTRRSIGNMFSSNFGPVSSYGGIPRIEEIGKNGDFSVFDLRTINSATYCFNFANKLGEGGFGSVYKGKLQNGKEIAVKRLSKCSGQGIEEFKNEVTLIARLQHRNLVQLLGCCIEQEEKMLVYEHLPNKGLDNFIFDKEKGALLDWRKRHNIILGIARGILYLHRDSRLKIIHRDLKASNVLLDTDMEPKISDFGMARKFNSDQVEGKTSRVVGTYGYMPPEYVMKGLFSEKSDVFSYGVLLLEIISGRRNNSVFGDSIVNLTAYVWELWEEGNALDTVDPIMGNSYNPNEVLRCIHIGLLCVQEHARDRPTMSEVLSMLCNETSIPLGSPKRPAFAITAVHRYINNPPCSPSALREVLDVATITIVEPR